jgi:hypothetical protein
LSENEYQQFREKYGDAFEVGMGQKPYSNTEVNELGGFYASS